MEEYNIGIAFLGEQKSSRLVLRQMEQKTHDRRMDHVCTRLLKHCLQLLLDFGFDFGFPPQMAYAFMAETIALTLEKRYESFTLGKQVELSQVKTIDRIAERHGFKLGGFRSFERAVTEEEIAFVKAQTAKKLN